MGTSGSFAGAKNALLPTWLQEPTTTNPPPESSVGAEQDGGGEEGEASEEGEVSVAPPAPKPTVYPPIPAPPINAGFGAARAALTRGARTSDSTAVRRGVANYVESTGGGRRAATRMSTARAVAGGIASLARTFSTEGPAAALRPFNLQSLAGAPAADVFLALTNVLCPPGGTIDEAIARDAMLETIAALAAQEPVAFDELTPAQLEEFFIGMVSRSIEGKIINEVGTNTIRLPPDVAAVERMQVMLHNFVEGCVRDRFSTSNRQLATLTQQDIDGFVSSLYAAAFDLLRTMGEGS